MANPNAFINGRQYPHTDVTLVIGNEPAELAIDAIDYTESASATLHLPRNEEEHLVELLGRDYFKRSFDINVSYSTTPAAGLTKDRLVDCRLKGTGYSPVPVSVMFVKHGN